MISSQDRTLLCMLDTPAGTINEIMIELFNSERNHVLI